MADECHQAAGALVTELLNAVKVIRARRRAMHDEAVRRARAAHAAGEDQIKALNADALERSRVTLLLPRLPDNDALHDRARRSRGLPPLTRSYLPQVRPDAW